MIDGLCRYAGTLKAMPNLFQLFHGRHFKSYMSQPDSFFRKHTPYRTNFIDRNIMMGFSKTEEGNGVYLLLQMEAKYFLIESARALSILHVQMHMTDAWKL